MASDNGRVTIAPVEVYWKKEVASPRAAAAPAASLSQDAQQQTEIVWKRMRLERLEMNRAVTQ